MADNPTTLLEKALARRADSGSSKPHWRELMERYSSAPSVKAVQAPEVIKGFYGSWASQFGSVEGSRDETIAKGPPPIQSRMNRLGQPGMAEINFRPYDWNTTRDGGEGPSLLGHPISFQVVGPTLRSRGCQWQWRVDTSGSQDKLVLDTISAVSTPAAVDASPVANLNEAYGLTQIPEEGLYLIVSLTGDGGDIDDGAGGTVPGGAGDGQFGEDAAPPGGLARSAIGPKTLDSKFEIFRVTSLAETLVSNDTLVLDEGKRLSDYFDIPNAAANTAVCRAVMLFKPAATRVVAVPGSGLKGQEQVFALVPPERSLNADFMPPRVAWDTDGGFDPYTNYGNTGTNFLGAALNYGEGNALPIPRAESKGKCRLQGVNGETVANLSTGLMRVILMPGTTRDPDADGKVIRLLDVESRGGGEMASAASEGAPFVADPKVEHLIGYWEIVDSGEDLAGNDFYDIRMVPQLDPATGTPFYGHANLLKMATGTAPGAEVLFSFSLHRPIKELWTGDYANPADIDSARIKNLIDPNWARLSAKGRSDATLGHLGSADKAVFNTASSSGGVTGTNANPGSLSDLGFRVVFFPAITTQDNRLVPDFNRPIEANEAILDPSKTGENQYIEMDYASGLVRLSHPPVAGTGCTLAPHQSILTSPANPRGEMTFFVSCVPFSREPGQMGTGARLTGGSYSGRPGDFCSTAIITHTDLYGERTFWPAASVQTITSGIRQEIKLSVALTAVDLPAQGFVDIVKGSNDPNGAPGLLHQGNRACTFGYTSVVYNDAGNGGNTTLKGVFGGSLPGTTSITVDGANPHTVVLRRNVILPNHTSGSTGTDYQYDTTYGWAKRASAIRFKQGKITPEADGSVSVEIEDLRTAAHTATFDDLFSSWLLSGGQMTSTGLGGGFGDELDFGEAVVLIQGLRSVMAAQTFQVSTSLAPKHIYVYIDSSSPECPSYATTDTLPLPSDQDILIGEYDHDGTDVLAYQDLRHPMQDVDKRLDITVGAPVGHAQPGDAHFLQLADAVKYVSSTLHPTAGDKGQFRRIKVIGPTAEDTAKLPIKVPDGIIIEGASRVLLTTQAITWASTDSLFDLSGVISAHFRDLAFHFDDSNLSPSSDITERNLFAADGGLLTEVVFDNIFLSGNAHGFFYHSGGGAGTGLSEVSFADCFATGLTDHAVYIDSTANACERVRMERCTFKARKSVAVPAPELTLTNSGVLHFGGTTAEDVSIRDTVIDGGDIGIYAGADKQILISNCWIRDTDNAGIALEGSKVTVAHCTLEAVHTLEAGPTTVHTTRAGIYQFANSDQAWIANNDIWLSGSNNQDMSIYLGNTSSDNHVLHNVCERGITVLDSAHVEGNYIDDAALIASGKCHIIGNVVSNAVSGNLRLNGSDNRLSNNIIGGDLIAGTRLGNVFEGDWFQGDGPHVVGDNNVFLGVAFGDPSDVTPAGRVTLGAKGTYTGCLFADGFQDAGAARSGNRLIGCTIRWNSADISVGGDDSVFLSNTITPDNNDAVFDFDGNGTVFCGNTVTGGTYHFHATAGARQEYVVSDNIVRNDGALPTRGGFFIEGDYSTVSGNHVQGRESLSASPDTYGLYLTGRRNLVSHNTVEAGIFLDVSNSTVQGNQTEGTFVMSVASFGSSGDCTVVGNEVQGAASLAPPNSSYLGNHFESTVLLSGTLVTFDGNIVGAGLTLTAAEQVVSNNQLLSTVVAIVGNLLSFKDNTVQGASQFGSDAGIKQDLVGNLFRGAVTCATTAKIILSTIQGNTFETLPSFSNGGSNSLDNCTVSGNYGVGMTAQSSTRCTFTGNRFSAAVDLSNSLEPVVQGNFIGSISGVGTVNLTLSGSDNYVVVGNRVTGTIVVDSGAAEADTGIVVGNRAGAVAAGATPTNGAVAVANKVDNGASVFSATPGTASSVANNVTD